MSETRNTTTLDATIDNFTLPVSGSPCVGVCLSGGGSRALTAGMGQLRALKYLGLLEKTTALSTVSGGSWVGATFSYIKPAVSDDTYLNKYVVDQSTLTPHASGSTPPEAVLDQLPDKNIGAQISKDFDMFHLALEACWLYFYKKVDTSMIWQTIVGTHILKPYDLYKPGRRQAPSTTFSYNETTRNSIISANPSLDKNKIHIFADVLDPHKTKRPFLVCNSSMFVKTSNEKFSYLTPVQATPLLTGIKGTPAAVDANKKKVGGGGTSSFGFSSLLEKINQKNVGIIQERQYALTDSIGTSSAFFAEFLQNIFTQWSADPQKFLKDLGSLEEESIKRIKSRYTSRTDENILEKLYEKVKANAATNKKDSFEGFLASLDNDSTKFLNILPELKNIIPHYLYWPVENATPDTKINPTRFADGGNLENTGINALLSYPAIERIIAFVNSETGLAVSRKGVFDSNGNEVPNTRIKIDSQLPPLFGYQPYDDNKGYVLFNEHDTSVFKYCQVFEPEMFAPLLQKIASATGENLNTGCATIKLDLNVRSNTWFGVPERGPVQLLLVYLNRTKNWYDILNSDVKNILGDFNDPSSYQDFPHYSTVTKTQLSATEINLLANFTAWNVASSTQAQIFKEMYAPS